MKTKLYLFIALLACLALPLAAAAQDSAPPDVSAPDAADFLDGEPNDTFATAAPLTPSGGGYLWADSRHGYFLTPADVDFYAFQTDAEGVVLSVIIDGDLPIPLRVEMALFDATHNLLAEDTTCSSDSTIFGDENAPPGSYFLRVRPCAGTYDANQPYRILDYYGTIVSPADLTEVEPNDTLAQATPITYGQIVAGDFEYNTGDCAADWFRFQGRAGDTLRFLDYRNNDYQVGLGHLYDAAGNYLPETVVLPADGTYYLKLLSKDPEWDDCYSGEYRFRLGEEALWVSAGVNALGGNTAINQSDIVTRKTGANQWAIVFDASDVGITKDVVAFDRLPNGSLLLSLGAAQTVPGLGKVMPQDVIRFLPTSLGNNTAGTFEWFLDGSDVGLTTSGEKIDAINWRADVAQPLSISLSGAGSLPRQSGGNLAVADEDVINFVATQVGATSAGKWRMGFDGSTRPGLGAEDVNALVRINLDPARLSFELMALTDAFNLGGQTGGPLDVLGLEAGNGPAPFRLTDKPIDGLAVGPAWTE
jgi:hypothetical protein